MMKSRMKMIHAALILLLSGLPAGSWAQDEKANAGDEADKDKAKAEKTSVVDSVAEVGLYYLDDDSYRYGKYSGLTDDGAYALLDFRWEKRPAWDSGDLNRWRLQGWRLGLDSRRLEFDWSQQGKQRFNFDYRQIPNNRFRDGMTPYLGLGGAQLNLPTGWEVAEGSSNTKGFLSLDEYLKPFDVDTERKSMTLAYGLKITPHWNMEIDFRHEVKDGVRNTWGIFGYGWTSARSVGIPAPVDWTTDNIKLMFNFADGRFRFGAGLYASFFKNDEKSLAWQNAYGRVPNWEPEVHYPDSQGLMALEPDNSYLQLKAYGGMNFNAKTRLTADLSWGTMEQDDGFFPYTINPDLRIFADLPRSNADAKINMTHFNIRLSSRLARRLNLVANYRYDDRDNKTPQAAYQYIGGDSQDQPRSILDSRINLPYSYTRHKADLLLNWSAARGIGIKGGLEWNDYSRSYAEVEDSDEIAYLAGIRFSSWQTLSASLDYRYSERDIDEYVSNRPYQESRPPGAVPPDAWQNHPWQRKYNQTDRERDEVRFRLDWFPLDEFNIGVTGLSRQDDYSDGAFGLNEADSDSWTLDLAYKPRNNLVLSAFYTKETWDASQSARTIHNFSLSMAEDPQQDWWADTEDQVDTFNFHLGWDDLGEAGKFGFGFDYTVSNVETRVDVRGAEKVDTLPLPKLVSDWSTFSVYGEMRLGERSSILLSAESGELEADDFALDNVVPDTLTKVLTLGQSTQDYDILLISASWRYRF
jgi:MtrB/PioB family decaheme-associated outer membrane protein